MSKFFSFVGPEHRPIYPPIDDSGVGIPRHDKIVAGVGVPVPVVVQEQRQPREIDLFTLEDDFLAWCGRDHFRLDASFGELGDAIADLVPLAAECPGELLMCSIRIGQERELAASDPLNQDRLCRITVQQLWKLVYAFLVLDADQETRLFHCVGEVR